MPFLKRFLFRYSQTKKLSGKCKLPHPQLSRGQQLEQRNCGLRREVARLGEERRHLLRWVVVVVEVVVVVAMLGEERRHLLRWLEIVKFLMLSIESIQFLKLNKSELSENQPSVQLI